MAKWIGVKRRQFAIALVLFHYFCFFVFFFPQPRASMKRTKRMELLISFNHIFFISQFPLPRTCLSSSPLQFHVFCVDERALAAARRARSSIRLRLDYLLHYFMDSSWVLPLSSMQGGHLFSADCFFVIRAQTYFQPQSIFVRKFFLCTFRFSFDIRCESRFCGFSINDPFACSI